MKVITMSQITQNAVLAIVANIVKNQDGNSEAPSKTNTEDTTPKSNNKKVENIRGRPKSGRFWKTKKERFSTINKTKGLRQNFDKKTALRVELKRTKELSRQVLEQHKEKEQQRKERRRENMKKTEENRRKAEVVQVITNTAKIKRMRKKQLRFIQKRDTNKEIEASK